MKDTWSVERPDMNSNEIRMASMSNYLLGNRFPGVDVNIGRTFSLYRFLLDHRSTPIHDLQKRITEGGRPVFTADELRDVMNVVKRQQTTPFAIYTIGKKQKGGGSVPIPTVSQPPNPLDSDPSRSKFWDKFIRKVSLPITRHIPPSWDGAIWYFHILYNLEQMKFIGPVISTALDMMTLSLPVMADLASELVGKFVSLAPVPYASFAGDAIGYAVSLVFISVAIVMNMSRKHFGSGFKASLEAVPLIGDILTEGAQSFETGAERYLVNRNKLLKPVATISPSAHGFLNYYVPDVEIHSEPAPKWDENAVKRNVAVYVAEETGVLNTVNNSAVSTGTNATKPSVVNTNKAAIPPANNAAKKGGKNVTRKLRR